MPCGRNVAATWPGAPGRCVRRTPDRAQLTSTARVISLASAGLVLGCLFLVPFPGWYLLIGYTSATASLTYLAAGPRVPILRRTARRMHRPFRMSAVALLLPLGFLAAGMVVYWAGFPVLRGVVASFFVAVALYAGIQAPAQGRIGRTRGRRSGRFPGRLGGDPGPRPGRLGHLAVPRRTGTARPWRWERRPSSSGTPRNRPAPGAACLGLAARVRPGDLPDVVLRRPMTPRSPHSPPSVSSPGPYGRFTRRRTCPPHPAPNFTR